MSLTVFEKAGSPRARFVNATPQNGSSIEFAYVVLGTTSEIDAARPLELLWVFGRPTVELTGFAQARIEDSGGRTFAVRVEPGVKMEVWGDASNLPVGSP